MKRIAILTLLLAATTRAKNVDLVTLPNRNTVQLTIYNSEDITLVKETRHITFKQGLNRLQFSWAGTLVDPSSVEFRPLEHRGEIELSDTVFPGQKPQHLVWNVASRFEGQARVEVTYFTSGLTWSMDYTAVTDPAEERMRLRGFVRVFNRSGEEYENAEIRLIVGKINLVEKISELARRQGIPVPQPGSAAFRSLRKKSAGVAFARAEKEAMEDSAKAIVKEGLSEYFMFRVDGSETVRNGWSKRMQAVDADTLAFRTVYRMRSHHYGPRPVRFFVWRNDDAHKLGDSPLPDGLIRIFRRNGQDGMSYLGQQVIRYVPIKAPIEVNLGPDDLVVYETRRLDTKRSDFRFNRHNNVSGWNETTRWIDTIRNYRGKPIVFELRRRWGGHADISSEIETTLHDTRTTEARFEVGARKTMAYPLAVVSRLGVNKTQERVFLR